MILQGKAAEVLNGLEAETVQTCVTSPPYFGLRDYNGGDGGIGLETTVDRYVANLAEVFRGVKRVLKPDGTLFLNLGDTMQDKSLLGVPWRVAFALVADGWILRNDIIWAKPNPTPESCKDRLTRAHEYVFLFSRAKSYKFNQLKETATYAGQRRGGSKNRYEQNSAGMDAKVYDTRNKRDVWEIRPASLSVAHFAVFPEELVEPCVLAGSDEGDIVLDPFSGSATTGVVARRLGRDYLGIELNPEYVELGLERLAGQWKLKRPTDLQTWHSVYNEIADALDTRDDETIRAFHGVLIEALTRQRSIAFDHNDTLIALAQSFDGHNPKRWLKSAPAIECLDNIPGFDLVVERVEADPYLYAHILGPGDSTEDRLFEALRAGLRPIPKLKDDSVWQEALSFFKRGSLL
jgi:site-specific DNA-methyltransferase (adenine-specific)